MSRKNKVNRDNYTQAGRLTQDDLARERQKQTKTGIPELEERVTNRLPEQPKQPGEQVSTPPRSAPEE